MDNTVTKVFDEFRKYIRDKGYEVDNIDEISVRGIKDEFKVHLLYDFAIQFTSSKINKEI